MKLLGTATASKPNFYYIVYDMISYRLGDFYNILYYILYIYIYLRIFSIYNTHTLGEGRRFLKKFTMVYIQNGLTLRYTAQTLNLLYNIILT